MSEDTGVFVDLLNFEDDYEILNTEPFTIRRKRDHYEIKEGLFSTGYVRVCLNGKAYRKHRLIALQFLHNDDPELKTDIDHINHNRSDNRLINLRWISPSKNYRNKSSFKGVNYNYVDDIPDDSLIVDFYETRNARHEFEGYYYHEGVFYYDNDYNYRILNINVNKSGNQFVCLRDIYGRHVKLYINRFLQQHDLL